MSLKIRDFIYLDTDRLKSILAQIQEGLIDNVVCVKSKDREVSAGAQGSLYKLLKAEGGAKYVWQDQTTETKALHDNIYNIVEEALFSDDSLIKIPSPKFKQEDIHDSDITSLLNDTSFILVTGKVIIDDYAKIHLILENFNELDKYLTGSNASIDKNELEGFKLLLDVFYKDKTVIKMVPFADYPNFHLVGNLNKDFLRDDISSIIYKYRSAPVSEWTIFAQVASIPPKDQPNRGYNINSNNSIEVELQKLFNTIRELELVTQSVVYPAIAITPIAIYRQ